MFPQRQVTALQDVAARLFDSRKTGGALEQLARELLRGFFEVCTYAGLDNVLDGLAVTERTGLEDNETVLAALVAQLTAIDLDGGGPRNAKPRQLAECVVAALGLTVVEEPDRNVSLGDDVRVAVVAAMATVVNAELAAPVVREAIITEARTRCDESVHGSFNKIVAQLDERGAHLIKQPKVPIDASQAVQRALTEARSAVTARIARAAIEQAKLVLQRSDVELAARIDQPIALRSTPREVAILRACDARVGMTSAKVLQSLLDSVTELARITWRAPEQTVHAYGASKTFAIGDLIEHPKFGRGTVTGSLAQRIDVEFPDGKHTLVHVPPRR
ncbi:MAG: hypothetical protein ABI591_13740 [Kofleriaceae bacterium]